MVSEPILRLRKKVLKENLWVFLFKLLQNKDSYAYELRKKVKEEYGFWAGQVTAYKVLYLLEKDSYVISYRKDRKKYYHLTKKGSFQIKKAKKFLEQIHKAI